MEDLKYELKRQIIEELKLEDIKPEDIQDDAPLTLICQTTGRAAIVGDMTRDSRSEQSGAGLDKLTPEEFRHFTDMNGKYRDRHGIPFIFAVRGATKHDILKGFIDRVDNDLDVEFKTALEQVERIIRFRLEDRVLA